MLTRMRITEHPSELTDVHCYGGSNLARTHYRWFHEAVEHLHTIGAMNDAMRAEAMQLTERPRSYDFEPLASFDLATLAQHRFY